MPVCHEAAGGRESCIFINRTLRASYLAAYLGLPSLAGIAFLALASAPGLKPCFGLRRLDGLCGILCQSVGTPEPVHRNRIDRDIN